LLPGYGTPGFSEPNQVELRGPTYGNRQIIPLIGGSGFAFIGQTSEPGSAGGGAILIAARQSITVNGRIWARSHGSVFNFPQFGNRNGYSGIGFGSGGAIRLVADRLGGSGTLDATSGNTIRNDTGMGRIRLEASESSQALSPFPVVPIVPPANPPQIWPADAAPTVRVLTVDGKPLPADPRAALGPPAADQDIATEGDSIIEIETTNLDPANAQVIVRLTPRVGDALRLFATFKEGAMARALWAATANIPPGFAAIQVRAVAP
jgi:hypothetical protein